MSSNENRVVYSTFHPTVTEKFNEYRRIRNKYGSNTIQARAAWVAYGEECRKFILNPVEEFERQLDREFIIHQ